MKDTLKTYCNMKNLQTFQSSLQTRFSARYISLICYDFFKSFTYFWDTLYFSDDKNFKKHFLTEDTVVS